MSRFAIIFTGLVALGATASASLASNLYVGTSFNAVDTDSDGIPDVVDNAPYAFNPSQADDDADALGNAADPSPSATDPDGDGIIDFIDPQPLNGSVYWIQYSLGGPYAVSIGQNLAIPFSANATTYTGFDRLAISVNGVPNVATYLLPPGATSLALSGTDLAALGINSPGTYTFGVTSFYNADSNYVEGQTSIIVAAPEPATFTAAASLAALAGRRRRTR